MLSSSAFQALSKADLYQLYTEVYKKMEEKDEIIKNYVIASNEFLSKAVPKKNTEPTGITETSKKVRSFQAFHIKEEQGNLVIGSSLVKNLVKDQTIPCDIGIHSYRGSTTDEKIEILKQYPKKR